MATQPAQPTSATPPIADVDVHEGLRSFIELKPYLSLRASSQPLRLPPTNDWLNFYGFAEPAVLAHSAMTK